jgi:hypothetical protein
MIFIIFCLKVGGADKIMKMAGWVKMCRLGE